LGQIVGETEPDKIESKLIQQDYFHQSKMSVVTENQRSVEKDVSNTRIL